MNKEIKDILAELESLGSEKVRKHYKKNGASDNQYGVKLGDIRKKAKQIKTDHKLGLELWETENIDARFLAILLFEPKSFTGEELEKLISSVSFSQVADWFINYVIKKHPDKEELRLKWMKAGDPMTARAGWGLTSESVVKNPKVLDIVSLLDRLDSEMGKASEDTQWTMNFTLAEIGIKFPEQRKRAISIGEKHGIYKDYPVSKGCTSPYAPIWINEISSRKK